MFTAPTETIFACDRRPILGTRDHSAHAVWVCAQECETSRQLRTCRQRPHFVVVQKQIVAGVRHDDGSRQTLTCFVRHDLQEPPHRTLRWGSTLIVRPLAQNFVRGCHRDVPAAISFTSRPPLGTFTRSRWTNRWRASAACETTW